MSLPMYQEKNKVPFNQIKYVVGVAAGKGGVGKSTLSVNLARAFQQSGFQVGIMDADIYGPSLRRLLPESQMPMKRGELIVPADCSGIKMISMAFFRKDDEAAVVRAPIANGVIKQFIQQVDWGELDLLIIDFPPGTGDIQLTLAQEARLTGAIMVTTPQELAVMDVRKAVNMFQQVNIPIVGVVENMSYFQDGEEKKYLFGKGGGDRLAREIEVPFLGEIPIHPEICQRGDQGRSIFEAEEVGIQDYFKKISENIWAELNRSKGILDYEFIQVDSHTFQLTRADGEKMRYRLSDLQRFCPCAGCVDEVTGQRKKDLGSVDDQVKAKRVEQVGRYGLRIDFTSGCSNGIYSYDSLFVTG
ncbi:MAG: Iron-sulfur cluster carrier protein [Chlamydiae bacterium]|nr:Iron-sulfur cluster carrier protein [Chlamydiota bacterium]